MSPSLSDWLARGGHALVSAGAYLWRSGMALAGNPVAYPTVAALTLAAWLSGYGTGRDTVLAQRDRAISERAATAKRLADVSAERDALRQEWAKMSRLLKSSRNKKN